MSRPLTPDMYAAEASTWPVIRRSAMKAPPASPARRLAWEARSSRAGDIAAEAQTYQPLTSGGLEDVSWLCGADGNIQPWSINWRGYPLMTFMRERIEGAKT